MSSKHSSHPHPHPPPPGGERKNSNMFRLLAKYLLFACFAIVQRLSSFLMRIEISATFRTQARYSLLLVLSSTASPEPSFPMIKGPGDEVVLSSYHLVWYMSKLIFISMFHFSSTGSSQRSLNDSVEGDILAVPARMGKKCFRLKDPLLTMILSGTKVNFPII